MTRPVRHAEPGSVRARGTTTKDEHDESNGGWCRDCTHAGTWPHSVFKTGALLLCQPSQMALPAGLPPASRELEAQGSVY